MRWFLSFIKVNFILNEFWLIQLFYSYQQNPHLEFMKFIFTRNRYIFFKVSSRYPFLSILPSPVPSNSRVDDPSTSSVKPNSRKGLYISKWQHKLFNSDKRWTEYKNDLPRHSQPIAIPVKLKTQMSKVTNQG